MNVKLVCPQCGQHYDVELEPGTIYDDMTCQTCGGKIPVSAAPQEAPQQNTNNNSAQSFPMFNNPTAVMNELEKAANQKDAARIRCPRCKHIFISPHDPEVFSGGCNCPMCGYLLEPPLKQHVVKPEDIPKDEPSKYSSTQEPQNASHNGVTDFFYVLAVISFVIGQILVLFTNCSVFISIDFNVSAIVFLLTAIFFKLTLLIEKK